MKTILKYIENYLAYYLFLAGLVAMGAGAAGSMAYHLIYLNVLGLTGWGQLMVGGILLSLASAATAASINLIREEVHEQETKS